MEDLKKALKCHSNYPEDCQNCPYRKCANDYCSKILSADALSAIAELEAKQEAGGKTDG